MGRLEVSCHRFTVLSGIRQDADHYSICVSPRSALLQKRGTLALITEPTGHHPALAADVCRLARDIIIRQYYADTSLSLTSSLLNALDSANSALLEYNHGGHIPGLPDDADHSTGGSAVAVRVGNVRTKRSMVGLTAVLLRADGTGLYLAQAAPTQAYIVHNGILSAIPEPPDWHLTYAPISSPAQAHETIGCNGNVHADADSRHNVDALWWGDKAEDEDEGWVHTSASTDTKVEGDAQGFEVTATATTASVPAPPLGSGPGVEADLVYRRVGPGDLIVLVSTSLARNLDRVTAEAIMLSDDAHAVTEGLFELACSLGLAEAHACVLQLGVSPSSGVEIEPELSAKEAYNPDNSSDRNGYQAGSKHHDRARPAPRLSSLLSMLKGGRQISAEDKSPPPAPALYNPDEQSQPDDDFPDIELPPHPTEALLMHTPEVPPVHVRPGLAPTNSESATSHTQEPEFDGWEDLPPALHRRTSPVVQLVRPQEPTRKAAGADNYAGAASGGSGGNGVTASWPLIPDVPTLFDPDPIEAEAEEVRQADEYHGEHHAQAGKSGKQATWVELVRHTQLASAGRSGALAAMQRVRAAVRLRKHVPARLPVRLVIGLILMLAGTLLVVSVLTISAGHKQSTVEALLRQAQQEDVAANALNISMAERQQHLTQALQKARQALAADPRSAEAQRMVARLQTQLDRAEGITRLGSPRLLFDLNQTNQSPTDKQQGTTQAPTDPTTSDPGSPAAASTVTVSTVYIGGILIQGNDTYVLDKHGSRIYRCSISAQNCTVVLNTGDSAGGQIVGPLVGMVLAVGKLVALDKNLTAYLFDSDTSAWQVQPLGDADKLELPYDVDSYDGNLYLLGAKPAQISKYFAGRYSEPPQDWITEQAALEQVKNPVSMTIDGHIYLLLRDGTVLVMQGGKIIKTIAPDITAAAVAGEPTALFTSTDTRDLYVLFSASGTITRISKEGQRLAMYRAPADNQTLAVIDAMTVDEGHSTVYLARGRQIYQARLSGGADMLDQAEP